MGDESNKVEALWVGTSADRRLCGEPDDLDDLNMCICRTEWVDGGEFCDRASDVAGNSLVGAFFGSAMPMDVDTDVCRDVVVFLEFMGILAVWWMVASRRVFEGKGGSHVALGISIIRSWHEEGMVEEEMFGLVAVFSFLAAFVEPRGVPRCREGSMDRLPFPKTQFVVRGFETLVTVATVADVAATEDNTFIIGCVPLGCVDTVVPGCFRFLEFVPLVPSSNACKCTVEAAGRTLTLGATTSGFCGREIFLSTGLMLTYGKPRVGTGGNSEMSFHAGRRRDEDSAPPLTW